MGVPVAPLYWIPVGQPDVHVPYPAVGTSVFEGAGIVMLTLRESVVFVTVAVPEVVGVKVMVLNPETEAGVALAPDTVQL
jgi:hypothetical protein